MVPAFRPFSLPHDFVKDYTRKQAPFGFNGLGELVYRRTYSRVKPDGRNERWHETVERVVNGTYRLQQRWAAARGVPWDPRAVQPQAQRMYDKIFGMKFLPPGRGTHFIHRATSSKAPSLTPLHACIILCMTRAGLWAMGSPMTEERHLYAALNNCAFVSTKDINGRQPVPASQPFAFLMDMSMLGYEVCAIAQQAGECEALTVVTSLGVSGVATASVWALTPRPPTRTTRRSHASCAAPTRRARPCAALSRTRAKVRRHPPSSVQTVLCAWA